MPLIHCSLTLTNMDARALKNVNREITVEQLSSVTNFALLSLFHAPNNSVIGNANSVDPDKTVSKQFRRYLCQTSRNK